MSCRVKKVKHLYSFFVLHMNYFNNQSATWSKTQNLIGLMSGHGFKQQSEGRGFESHSDC